MKEYTYVIETLKGDVLVKAKNIAEARAVAKKKYKVKHPKCVRRDQVYVWCAKCDSKPCCC